MKDAAGQFDESLPLYCPGCGQWSEAGHEVCWLCGRHVSPAEAARQVVTYVHPFASKSWWQYSIKSLLLVTTFVSVLLALWVVDPLIGIVGSILAIGLVLTALRTRALNIRFLQACNMLPSSVSVGHFKTSACQFVVIASLSVSVSPVFWMAVGLYDGQWYSTTLAKEILRTGASSLGAISFMLYLAYQTWPKRFRPPPPLAPQPSAWLPHR